MLEKRKAVRKILTHRQKFLSAVSRRYPQWLPFMKPVAVVARSGGHIPRGADECSGRCSGRHKWRPYVFQVTAFRQS
ncbi:unknown [Prevotella sp. CAG:755]|nr:unknown [Prevotella sp. CAG:755]